MSKYDRLWKYVAGRKESFTESFDEIERIGGCAVDHSFLSFKKELIAYGFKVGKISMKNKTIEFIKIVQ